MRACVVSAVAGDDDYGNWYTVKTQKEVRINGVCQTMVTIKQNQRIAWLKWLRTAHTSTVFIVKFDAQSVLWKAHMVAHWDTHSVFKNGLALNKSHPQKCAHTHKSTHTHSMMRWREQIHVIKEPIHRKFDSKHKMMWMRRYWHKGDTPAFLLLPE